MFSPSVSPSLNYFCPPYESLCPKSEKKRVANMSYATAHAEWCHPWLRSRVAAHAPLQAAAWPISASVKKHTYRSCRVQWARPRASGLGDSVKSKAGFHSNVEPINPKVRAVPCLLDALHVSQTARTLFRRNRKPVGETQQYSCIDRYLYIHIYIQ